MDEQNRHSRSSLIWYFLFSALFAICAMRSSKLYSVYSEGRMISLAWVFWFFISASVVCLIPLLNAILIAVQKKTRLPRIIRMFYDVNLRDQTFAKMHIWKTGQFPLWGRMGLACIVIVIVVTWLSSTSLMNQLQRSAQVYEVAARILAPSSQNRNGILGSSADFRSPTHVAGLYYFSDDDGQKQYLKDCVTIVRQLKDAGVKAVLVSLRNAQIERSAFAELDKTGIVVLGMKEMGTRYVEGDSTGYQVVDIAPFTMPTDELGHDNPLKQITGKGWNTRGAIWNVRGKQRLPDSILQNESPLFDVTLQLYKKYRGYPNEMLPQESGGFLSVGNDRIPVTSDGLMYFYSRLPSQFWSHVPVWASRQKDSLSLGLADFRESSRERKIANNEDLRSAYSNKIVFIDWPGRGSDMASFYLMPYYSIIMDKIMKNEFISVSAKGYLWITLACVFLAGWIALRVRGLIMLCLMFSVGIGIVALGTYFAMNNTLVDVMYPLLSLALSALILPSIRMVHESRLVEGE